MIPHGRRSKGARRYYLYDTPFETGLRSVVVLTACYPHQMTLRQMVVLDYLCTHTGDFGGPSNIDPLSKGSGAGLLVRRGLVEAGLNLMITRRLIQRSATKTGFQYNAGDEAGTFLDFLRSEYMSELKNRALWLSRTYSPLSEDIMNELIHSRISKWEPEFQAGSLEA